MGNKELARDLKRAGLSKQYKSAVSGLVAGTVAFLIAIYLFGSALFTHDSIAFPIALLAVTALILGRNILFFMDMKKQLKKLRRADRKKGYTGEVSKHLKPHKGFKKDAIATSKSKGKK